MQKKVRSEQHIPLEVQGKGPVYDLLLQRHSALMRSRLFNGLFSRALILAVNFGALFLPQVHFPGFKVNQLALVFHAFSIFLVLIYRAAEKDLGSQTRILEEVLAKTGIGFDVQRQGMEDLYYYLGVETNRRREPLVSALLTGEVLCYLSLSATLLCFDIFSFTLVH